MAQRYFSRNFFSAVSFTLLGYTAISQTSPCGPVVQNFNTASNGMAGFTSSALRSAQAGFTYASTGTNNGFLARCEIPSGGSVYEIVSPTYQSFASQTTVGYGFELSGPVVVSNIIVYLQYIDNTNQINSVFMSSLTPIYTGTGSNAIATICQTFDITSVTGFTPGEAYRIILDFTAAQSSNNNQCIVFDNFRTTGTNAAAPLPVSFTGFGAKKIDAGVQLIWNVAGERDVASYEVERSTTGANFTKLGSVAATNSAAYFFVDNQPVSGTIFYRIKEVDVDGHFKYSTIARLNLSSVFQLRAYPSPARDQVTIEHSPTSKGSINITTTDGRVVKQVDIKPDLNQAVINISALKAGMYIVRFTNANGQTETTKLIKE